MTIFGLYTNMFKIWVDNFRARIPKEKNKRFIFILLLTLVFAFIIEASNALFIKWWYYTKEWTFGIIIIVWLLLGMILATLNITGKRKAAGPVFAIFGLTVESLNLLYFNSWAFTSSIGLIGTYIVWILFGFLIWSNQHLLSRRSNYRH